MTTNPAVGILIAVVSTILTYLLTLYSLKRKYLQLGLKTMSVKAGENSKFLRAECSVWSETHLWKDIDYAFIIISKYTETGADPFDNLEWCKIVFDEHFEKTFSRTNDFLAFKEIFEQMGIQCYENPEMGCFVYPLPYFYGENIHVADEYLQYSLMKRMMPGEYSVRFFIFPPKPKWYEHLRMRAAGPAHGYHRSVHDAVVIE
jgi:hypothetical protein